MMSNPFFDHPILNSPYARPKRHWELDEQGQPTQAIIETRRRAEFITPIPKPKKKKKTDRQEELIFDEGKGSIFVQIGDENVHRVRALMDEVFGDENFCGLIVYAKTTSATNNLLPTTTDFLLWYSRKKAEVKYRQLYNLKEIGGEGSAKYQYVRGADGSVRTLSKLEREQGQVKEAGSRVFRLSGVTSQSTSSTPFPVSFEEREFKPPGGSWKTNQDGFRRLRASERLFASSNSLNYVQFIDDFPAFSVTDIWSDIGGIQSRSNPNIYVVQTATAAIERCVLMSTDPGDLVLDPTCGSGTTAYVAEQWGRRWITIDTSRVALALARARIMGARYPYYLLADSREGQEKEAEVTRTAPSTQPVHGNIRHGFVYERVPHITLKSIANNAEIDVIWEKWQAVLEPLREQLNAKLGTNWQEWEIPRDWNSVVQTFLSAHSPKTNVARTFLSAHSPKTNVARTFLSAHSQKEKPSVLRRAALHPCCRHIRILEEVAWQWAVE